MADFQITVQDNLREISRYVCPEFPVRLFVGRASEFRDRTVACHWHEDLEFTFLLEGSMTYYVNDATYPLRSGMGIFVNTNRLHYDTAKENEDCTYHCVILHPSLLGASLHIEKTFVEPLLYGENTDALIFSPEVPWQHKALAHLRTMAKLLLEQKPIYELKIQSTFLRFWTLFAENWKPVKKGGNTKPAANGQMKSMIAFIHQFYAEKITLSQVARKGAVCRSKCCAMFKANLHQSVFEYLTRYRVRKSLELLADKSISVSEIASACGFASASFFAETFRKVMGLSPRAYRARF
jgi:AraC-like DNA-binding protein